MIRAKSLKYILYIEGVQVPAQVIQFNNISGQGCSMSANIPPHPMCHLLKRGMYVQLFKRVNNEEGKLRFSGILMNKVYSKTGDGRELRIECASPEIRLSALKISEMNAGQMSMLPKATLRGISYIENAMQNIKYDTISDYIEDLSAGKDERIKSLNTLLGAQQVGSDPFSRNMSIGTSEIVQEYNKSNNKQDFKKNLNIINEDLSKFYRTGRNLKNNTQSEYWSAMLKYAGEYRKNQQAASQKKTKDNEKEVEIAAKNIDIISDGFNKARDKYFSLEKDSASTIKSMNVSDFVKYKEVQSSYDIIVRETGDNAKNKSVLQSYSITSNTMMSNIGYLTQLHRNTAYNSMTPTMTTINVPSDNGSTENPTDDKYDQIVQPTLARRFTSIADKCDNDYFQAVVNLIEEIYSMDEEVLVKREARHFGLLREGSDTQHALCRLGVVTAEAFKNAEAGRTMTHSDTGTRFATLSYLIANTINQIINSSEGGVTVMSIIQQILSTLMASYSVIHTQFHNSIMVHPIMCNYFPPCRNVVFPCMISSIQYNANDWANPTRTYMIYRSYLLPYTYNSAWMDPGALSEQVAIAPKESRELRYINYEAMKQTEESGKEEESTWDSIRNSDAYKNKKDEELTEKDWADIYRTSHACSASFKKRVEGYKLINNHFSEEEEEIGRTINIVNYGLGYQIKSDSGNQVAMADMYHGLAKYGCRSCVITGGDELDDLVVGMPILVLDHVYSIYGIVSSLSFTVTGDGNVQSSVTISMPRMPLISKYDVLTHAGLWFDSDASTPDTIGKAYSEIFGNTETAGDQSLFDFCKKTDENGETVTDDGVEKILEDKLVNPFYIKNQEGMDDDTTLLKLCIARLNNKYILAEDKTRFINNLRSVKEDTEDLENVGNAGSMRNDSPRNEDVYRYISQLGITDNESHKYASVTPDSLTYDDMGFITLDIVYTDNYKSVDTVKYSESTEENKFKLSDDKNTDKLKNTESSSDSFKEHSLNMPVKGRVSSKYGWRFHPVTGKRKFHKGIDIAAGKGTTISSVADGKVIFSGTKTGYGNIVEVKHSNGYITKYAHCNTLSVKVGDIVKSGQKIAEVGSTGVSTGNHCHFEIRNGKGEPVNPAVYLK